MMRVIYMLLCFLLLLCYACANKNGDKTEKSIVIQEETKPFLTKEQQVLKNSQQLEEQKNAYSMRMYNILNRAILKANPHLKKERYETHYEEFEDSLSTVTIRISIGHLFSEKERHLLIARSDMGEIYHNIYVIKKNDIETVLENKHWKITYISDTIQDINGDNLKDFVINGYGSSGCCLKAFSEVFILKKDNRSFSDRYHFINPTFSPKEHLIKGICYGHLGETEMYKYKWNEEAIDTIEFISFQKNKLGEKTGNIIRSNKRFWIEKGKKDIIVTKIPKEYREIYGFDWFMGKI
ncbi:hypothetical protein IMCC3317_30380 [Kordia antarctica]|uniref:FG-GAP repeat protein n=1 Tax=Kordia antarctica TaxID=1218801 RepID=A0A7L4ZMD0_9FLAO|nr:hypothetical protein [Kordia antarctica]QHI37657.1 hypothetical protein IMCC3317_30380 [Kordia antarctica]